MVTNINEIIDILYDTNITLSDYYKYSEDKFPRLCNEFRDNVALLSSYTTVLGIYNEYKKTTSLCDVLLLAKKKELKCFLSSKLSDAIGLIFAQLSNDRGLKNAFDLMRKYNITNDKNWNAFIQGPLSQAGYLYDVYLRIIVCNGEYEDLIKESNKTQPQDVGIIPPVRSSISSDQSEHIELSPIEKCVCNELYKTINNLVEYTKQKEKERGK